jgi:hypothetical protein
MKSCTLPVLVALIRTLGSDGFVPSQLEGRSIVTRDWKTHHSVLAEPPRKGQTDQLDDFDSESDTSNLQPIRRLRRDKKEPLIAIVGRPNVVRLPRVAWSSSAVDETETLTVIQLSTGKICTSEPYRRYTVRWRNRSG